MDIWDNFSCVRRSNGRAAILLGQNYSGSWPTSNERPPFALQLYRLPRHANVTYVVTESRSRISTKAINRHDTVIPTLVAIPAQMPKFLPNVNLFQIFGFFELKFRLFACLPGSPYQWGLPDQQPSRRLHRTPTFPSSCVYGSLSQSPVMRQTATMQPLLNFG